MESSNTLTTASDMVKAIEKLKKAFPSNTDDFFGVMAERILANKITQYQLEKGIEYVLDFLHPGQLSIAAVLTACKERELMVKYKCGKQVLTTTLKAYQDNKRADAGNSYTKVELIEYIHQ